MTIELESIYNFAPTLNSFSMDREAAQPIVNAKLVAASTYMCIIIYSIMYVSTSPFPPKFFPVTHSKEHSSMLTNEDQDSLLCVGK